MSKKDYALIAEIIRGCTVHQGAGPSEEWLKARAHTLHDVAHTFAHHLGSANPSFDRARFIKACGVES